VNLSEPNIEVGDFSEALDALPDESRNPRDVLAYRARQDQDRRELFAAFDDAVGILMRARLDICRYLNSPERLTGVRHLLDSDFDRAHAAIEEIRDRLSVI